MNKSGKMIIGLCGLLVLAILLAGAFALLTRPALAITDYPQTGPAGGGFYEGEVVHDLIAIASNGLQANLDAAIVSTAAAPAVAAAIAVVSGQCAVAWAADDATLSGQVASAWAAADAVVSGQCAVAWAADDATLSGQVASAWVAADTMRVDTNAIPVATNYTPRYIGDILIGSASNAVWLAKGATVNDWLALKAAD